MWVEKLETSQNMAGKVSARVIKKTVKLKRYSQTNVEG